MEQSYITFSHHPKKQHRRLQILMCKLEDIIIKIKKTPTTYASVAWNMAGCRYGSLIAMNRTPTQALPNHLASCQSTWLTCCLTLWLLFVLTAVFTLEPKRCIRSSVALVVNVCLGKSEPRFPWTGIRVIVGKSDLGKMWKKNQANKGLSGIGLIVAGTSCMNGNPKSSSQTVQKNALLESYSPT